ncbi:class I SAM-dependent methyltransferase [Pseudacidovorax intermedius]|uniref:Methyltransferase n=1 Tax=Pseudacidovorax intermedius TaxID=433924 RepID=A0A147GR15_9BURK|nr:class I SAM-dependent methyltransferase [Pseudacidovorax intermedius]KTT18385.1 methyltransferase [Pseudacidovorax intermedius]
MQDYYAARAAEYDAIYAKPERQADLRQMEAWLPGMLAGRHVLEVACGTGYWTQFYAAATAGVVALDGAVETLRIAAHRLPDAPVRWLQGDAYALPVADRVFDGAFAGFWWSHIPLDRIDGFLQGLHRTLKPGAQVVFIDNLFVPGSSTPIAEHDSDGNTWQLRRLADGTTHRVLKNFPSRDALLAAVQPHARISAYRAWAHFWALSYSLRG